MSGRVGGEVDVRGELLVLLARFRAVTTGQAHQLVGVPAGRSLRAVQWHLQRLVDEGLVERRRRGRYDPYRCTLTGAGAGLVGERPPPVSVFGPKAAHHDVVVEVGAFFVQHAAGRRHRCGFRDYRLEVKLGRARSGRPGVGQVLRPDAVLSYETGRGRYTKLVEVDRDTESITVLAAKLAAYNTWITGRVEPPRRGRPASSIDRWWERDFPDLNHPPEVLFVFDGPTAARTRRRINQIARIIGQQQSWHITVEATTLELMRRHANPFAANTAIRIDPYSGTTTPGPLFTQ